MSETLTVRDHSQPCEHEGRGTAQFDRGAFVSGGYYQCNVTACPGGREIVLRPIVGYCAVHDSGYTQAEADAGELCDNPFTASDCVLVRAWAEVDE